MPSGREADYAIGVFIDFKLFAMGKNKFPGRSDILNRIRVMGLFSDPVESDKGVKTSLIQMESNSESLNQ